MSEKEAIERLNSSARTLYLLKMVEKFAQLLVNQRVGEFQITGGEYVVLSLINRPGALSSAQISRRLSATPQATREFITSLEGKGLIERFEDPENRRILRVRLTDTGRTLIEACEKSVDEVEAELFDGVTQAEELVLRSVLNKILQRQREKSNP